jgi:1,4-dihydroxy-2-naphthoate octaprenyltransferase
MDIEPDEKSGRRTLATKIGRVPAKFFVASLLLIECFLVSQFFSDRALTIFLALGALFFLLDAIFLWKNRAYSPSQMRLFLWGWNFAAVLGILWNALHGSLLFAHPLR